MLLLKKGFISCSRTNFVIVSCDDRLFLPNLFIGQALGKYLDKPKRAKRINFVVFTKNMQYGVKNTHNDSQKKIVSE